MLNELYTFAEPVQVVPFSSLKWGKFTLLHTADSSAWLSGRTGLQHRFSGEGNTAIGQRHSITADSYTYYAGVPKDFTEIL